MPIKPISGIYKPVLGEFKPGPAPKDRGPIMGSFNGVIGHVVWNEGAWYDYHPDMCDGEWDGEPDYFAEIEWVEDW